MIRKQNIRKISKILLGITTIALTTIRSLDYEILKLQNNPESTWRNGVPGKSSTSIYRAGNTLNQLRSNATAAYSPYWKSIYREPIIGEKGRILVKQVLSSLSSRIKVIPISDSIAIVQHPFRRADTLFEVSSVDQMTVADDIWQLEKGVWVPVFGGFLPYSKAERVDLNGDGFLDIVLIDECCEARSIDIYINQNNESMRLAQQIDIIGELFLSLGAPCAAKISVTAFTDSTLTKTVTFSCSEGRFRP